MLKVTEYLRMAKEANEKIAILEKQKKEQQKELLRKALGGKTKPGVACAGLSCAWEPGQYIAVGAGSGLHPSSTLFSLPLLSLLHLQCTPSHSLSSLPPSSIPLCFMWPVQFSQCGSLATPG
jgi:hypothetical protein